MGSDSLSTWLQWQSWHRRRKEANSQHYWERQLAAMVEATEHTSSDSSYLTGEGDDCRCQECGSQEC